MPTTAVAQARPPAPARAQGPPRAALPRFFVTGGAGLQVTSSDFTQQIEFDMFQEVAQIGGPVEMGRAPRFIAGAGVRVRRRLGVGVAIGGSRATGEMEATYLLPNPFQFAAARMATATTPTRRSTLDTHVQAIVLLNEGDVWTVTLHAGPTFSRVSQELATDRLAFTYVFPFTEVVLTEIGRSASTDTGIGGHIGVSMARRLRGRIGLDTQLLWHTATARLVARDLEGAPRQDIQAGGFQVLVGLRYSR